MARVLVVEDEPLIAMMLEDWLVEMGHQPVGAFDCIDTAVTVLDKSGVDIAILDVNIRGRLSDPVADILLERAIPFAFATGGSSQPIDARFSDVPTVAKPYDFAAMRAMVDALIELAHVRPHATA